MPFEKSAGAIIFRNPHSRTNSLRGKNKETKYLLLHYPSGSRSKKSHGKESLLRGRDYWDFPKGHIEKGEKEIETVKREVKEETGLENIEIIEEFKEWIKYFFKFEDQTIFKIVTFYLAKTDKEDIKISPEHIGYKWLPYEEALNQLNFDNAKKILKKANKFLIENATTC